MSDINFSISGEFKQWPAPSVSVRQLEPQLDEIVIDWKRSSPAEPESFAIESEFDKGDADYQFSTSQLRGIPLLPEWAGAEAIRSELAANEPAVFFISPSGTNRLALAVSEVKRKVIIRGGLVEENGRIRLGVCFFSQPESALSEYHAVIRIDRRAQFYADTMAGVSQWFERECGCPAAWVPALALEPVYSSWYTWHQNLSSQAVDEQMAVAARFGLKGVILDDGWQTDDNNRGYAFCGDWEVSKNRFPDFAGLVRKIHERGMYCMLWYAVPFVGPRSKAFDEYKDKMLYSWDYGDVGCLDPRFPEVREYLAGVYERAVREWDLDGLKLDFIDSFTGSRGPDPAVSQGYAGRDIKSIPDAVDKLLGEVLSRLKAIKPELLVEFRQSYFGPAIRKYGTMIRAADCPDDCISNRIRTITLRLTCGNAPVHSDMLMWRADESTQTAARQLLNVLFSVPQISVDLNLLPPEHQQMLHFWLAFWRNHRQVLLRGKLRPYLPQNDFALVTAENDLEMVAALYGNGQVVSIPADGRRCSIVNAADMCKVAVDNPGDTERRVVRFDAMGNFLGESSLPPGLHWIEIPVCGLAEVGAR